jgi:hypothetical protein
VPSVSSLGSPPAAPLDELAATVEIADQSDSWELV